MLGLYLTRNGNVANVNGISEYFLFGETQIILSGIVNSELVAWDSMGNYRTNQVLGITEKHDLDLVSTLDSEQQNNYTNKEENNGN